MINISLTYFANLGNIKSIRKYGLCKGYDGMKYSYCKIEPTSTSAPLKASVVDDCIIGEDQSVGSTQGETGRSAVYWNSRTPTDASLIESHIKEFVAGRPNPFEGYLDDLVEHFGSQATFTGDFFRGVPFTTDLKGKKTIGPSPYREENRYNVSTEKYIYLIDDLSYLPVEIRSNDCLVQDYRIVLATMKIANLSADNKDLDNSISLIFQMTELGRTTRGYDFEDDLKKTGKSRYLLSQSVANSFKKFGWEGLYVPGVHGTCGKTYRNLVLFGDCVDSYCDWLVGEYYKYSHQGKIEKESA